MVLLFCLSFCLFLSNCSTNRLNISIYLTQNLVKIGKFRILVQTSNPQTSYGTKVGLINVGLTNIRLVQTSDQYNNYIYKVVFSVRLSVCLFVCLFVSKSGTLGPICIKFWSGTLDTHGNVLDLENHRWVGRLL